MLIRVSTVLEALTSTIFLHQLYGKRYELDYKSILFIGIHLAIFQGINEAYFSQEMSVLVYAALLGYAFWKFGGTLKELIVNIVLYFIILGGLQSICMAIVLIFIPDCNQSMQILCMNVFIFLLSIVGYLKLKLSRLSYYFCQNDVIIRIILGVGIAVIIFCVYQVRALKGMFWGQYTFACIGIVLFCLMAGSWKAYKMKAAEREAELKAYQLYGENYENLILEIRMRQHEFNNHLNAIYSQHLICNNYDELVERQKEYCGKIEEDNRFEKLLVSGNSVLTGFLYGKFLEAEKRNIKISYNIESTNIDIGIPAHKIIEIFGTLLNNAMEAVEMVNDRKIHIMLKQQTDELVLEVRNVGEKVGTEDFVKMFSKGYSKKGKYRGLGLYNLKQMSKEYGFQIVCENKKIENENWISFVLKFKGALQNN